jgi:hypothetical protein
MKSLRWLGPAIFAISLLVRLIGINWGLPNALHSESYHPDEPINFAYSQQIDPAHLQFTPGFYNYGTFFLTLSRIASAYCPMPDTLTAANLPEFERCCLMAGRLVSAFAGAGTAWVIFGLLRRRTHFIGAAIGGMAIGIAPAFVMHSRFDTVDVTATFLFALSMLFALKLLPDQEGENPSHYIRWAVLAGLFAGLSAGTKYTGGVGLIGVFVAVYLARKEDAPKLILASTAAALLAFVISTPGVILDNQKFKQDLAYEMMHVATGQGLVFVNTPPASLEHIFSLVTGIGFLAFVFGMVGLGYATVKKYPWVFVVLAFALPYYLIISRGQVKYLRYTFPLYPPICIGLGWLAGQAHKRRDQKGRLVVGFAILAVGMQAVATNQYNGWMAGLDPRDEAGQYFKDLAKTKPDLTVGVTDDPWFYTPALYPDTAMSRGQWQRMGPQKMNEARNPYVVYYRPYETPNIKPDYVTYSSLKAYDLNRLLNAKDLKSDDQALVDQWKATLDALKRDYSLATVPFGGKDAPRIYREDLEYVHPYVYVWKRKDLH